MANKQVKARAGMVTLICGRCDGGTLFVPVTLRELAEMRANGNNMTKMVVCHKGCHVEVSLFA